MLNYYKNNTEVGSEFGVSEGAVRNWIRKTTDKIYNLELIVVRDKERILKTEGNALILQKLSEEGKKYKSLEDREVVIVPKESYKHLTSNQVTSLITSMQIDKYLQHKFSHLDKGAKHWETFYNKTMEDAKYTTSHSDLYYFENAYKLIKEQFRNIDKINIVDIGCGNGKPVIELLKKLNKDNFLASYTAIDISKDMLSLTKSNLKNANLDIATDFKIADLENNSLQEILYGVKYKDNYKYPTLVLCLGATIANQESILHASFNIKDGLLPEDRLMITNSFAANEKAHYDSSLFSIAEFYNFATWFPRSLGISQELTTDEMFFNKATGCREFGLVLQKDLDLVFEEFDETVRLYKNDKIIVWKHKKDTFTTISNLADSLELKLKMIVKHPVYENIMYMMSKG